MLRGDALEEELRAFPLSVLLRPSVVGVDGMLVCWKQRQSLHLTR